MRDFALEVHFSKWEFKARYNLTGSDAESMSIAELLAFASDEDRHAFENLHLGYTETFGSPALRQAIAQTYESMSADEILCFAGATEGIFTAMQVLLKAGDHAIVITPNYQSAETVPLSICDVSGVALDEERAWALDIDRLRDAIRDYEMRREFGASGRAFVERHHDARIVAADLKGLYDDVAARPWRRPERTDALTFLGRQYGALERESER